jgi:protein phosphatase
LGPEPNINIDLEGPFPVERGDTYLLCSDGLTGLVPDDELAPALAHLTPDMATRLLTNLALLRGGHDNITLIIARVVSDKLSARGSRSAPLVIGESDEPVSPVHVGLWIALGLLLLVSGALFVVSETTTYGWIALAASAIPGLAILAKITGLFRDGGVSLSSGRRLGKAPYTDTPARSETEFAQHLISFLVEARDTAKSKEWDIIWAEMDAELQQALSKLTAGKSTESFPHILAVSEMFAEACRQRAKKATSSQS